MTSRSYRCVPESHSAGNAATSHPSEGRQCHASSTVQIGSAELFPVLTHCSPSCWLTRQRAYRALLRKVKQVDTTLSPRCHQRTGNPSPLRSAVGSWFSPLLIAVVTLGLPQEAAATFPAMPLSNLFANAVLRAQHLHLLNPSVRAISKTSRCCANTWALLSHLPVLHRDAHHVPRFLLAKSNLYSGGPEVHQQKLPGCVLLLRNHPSSHGEG